MSFEETMQALQSADEERGWRWEALHLRKLLAGALCASCGDPLGSDEPVMQFGDDDQTVHAKCRAVCKEVT